MSLKVWLPLDGDLHNQGVSSLNLTNTVTFSSPGKIGQYCLNSQLGWFNVPEMDGAKQMSFAYWVKINEGTITDWLDTFSWYSTNGSSSHKGRQEFYYYNTETETMTTGSWYPGSSNSGFSGVKIGQWYHYAFTIDYETRITKFYINGTLRKTTTNVTAGYCIRPGGNQFLLRESSLNSSINDFRLYDHCLSAAEVKEIAQGLVLHYKLDTTYASNIIQDSSGYNHNGVITGTITLDNDSPKYAASSYVNGSSYILTPAGSFGWNDLTQLTISAWMKPTASMTKWRGSVGIAADANQNSRGIAITDYNNEFRGTYPNGSTYATITTGKTLTQNEWHHCVGTLNGTEFKLYFDGELVKTQTIDWGTATLNTNARFEVGVDLPGSDEKFTGNYSDVRLYCTPLLDTDIKLLYNNGMRIDNLQNIHTFELIENKNKVAITRTGQLYCDSLNETTATKFHKNLIVETTEIIER